MADSLSQSEIGQSYSSRKNFPRHLKAAFQNKSMTAGTVVLFRKQKNEKTQKPDVQPHPSTS